jgi:hypothetical protein
MKACSNRGIAVRHLVADDRLDLVHQRLALLGIEFAGLADIEVVDLGQGTVGVHAVLGGVGLEARGGVAESGGDARRRA